MSEKLDNASPANDPLSRRLRQLRSAQIDLSTFDARLRAALPPRRESWIVALLAYASPMRAAVAGVCLLAIVLGVAAVLWTQPAVASQQEMAELYRTATSGGTHTTAVDSVDEARAALRRSWPGVPEIPESAEMKLMSCCVHEVGRRQMACVTFAVDDQPVTLAFAGASDLRPPRGQTVAYNGRTYVVGSADGVNMVMSESNGVWMCLMGKQSHEQLASIAQTLRP